MLVPLKFPIQPITSHHFQNIILFENIFSLAIHLPPPSQPHSKHQKRKINKLEKKKKDIFSSTTKKKKE